MVVNDQSLEYGGLFDDDWTSGLHNEHKDGRMVDIPFQVYIGGSVQCTLDTGSICLSDDPAVEEETWKYMHRAVKENLDDPLAEPAKNHWHGRKW